MPDGFDETDKRSERKQKCVHVVGDSFILYNCIKLLLYLKNKVMQSFHFIAVKISSSYHVVHGSQERFRVNSLQEMLNEQCFTRKKKSIVYSFIIQKLK